MATLAATLDPALKHAPARLLVACLLSFVLHVALLLGVPVNPTGGVPSATSTIYARLEPAAGEAQAEVVTEPLPPVDAVEPKPAAPASADPLAEPVAKQPEPKPRPAAAVPPSSPSAGIEVPLIRDPTYYPAKQLDVYPQPLTPIRLHYPETAVADRVDGRLLLLLLIDEFGVVTEAAVVEAAPAGYFEEAARSVFRVTRFTPGMKQGHAVKSRVLVQVRYVYGESEGSIR